MYEVETFFDRNSGQARGMGLQPMEMDSGVRDIK
jgi:hypothetical protein